MASKQEVNDFISQKTLAIVGVSRGGKKFGNTIFRDLRAKGYHVIPVHPKAEELEGERCFPSLKELPEQVGGVVVVVPPAEAQKVVRDAEEANIPRIWLQQGSESNAALNYCKEKGIQVVSGECILMFAQPRFPHTLHRGINGLFGKLPK
ncbi:MAG: CoA-binding protein [Chloroflexi bacterium]|nr:CoA-binding protein [Chloroflexota bacterium]